MKMFGIQGGSAVQIEIKTTELTPELMSKLPVPDSQFLIIDKNTRLFNVGGGREAFIIRKIEKLPIKCGYTPQTIDGVDYIVQEWNEDSAIEMTKFFEAEDAPLYFCQQFARNPASGKLRANGAPKLLMKINRGYYVPPLKNIYRTSGNICTGDNYGENYDGTIAGFEKMYQHFLTTKYNIDLGGIPDNEVLRRAIKWRVSDDQCCFDTLMIKGLLNKITGGTLLNVLKLWIW